MTKKTGELRTQNGTVMNRCCCRFSGSTLPHTFCESYLQLDQIDQFVVPIIEVKIYF